MKTLERGQRIIQRKTMGEGATKLPGDIAWLVSLVNM